jgi:lysophospholipase L1-like esterase
MIRAVAVVGVATSLLLLAGEFMIFHRSSAMEQAQAAAQSRAQDLATASAIEQKSATATLASRLGEQSAKIEKLSEAVRLSMPREIGLNHTDVRIFAIKSQIAQAEDPIVIVGDSITEGALLPSSVCGRKLINGGVAGADTGSYAAIANDILPEKAIPLIVVALGTNNSSRTAPRHTFAKSYGDLADILMPHATKLMLAGIPQVEMAGAFAKSYFDSDSIDRHDAKIRSIAKQRAADFIDLRSGVGASGMTADGVHLNVAGYRLWNAAILSGIEAKLGCKTAQN